MVRESNMAIEGFVTLHLPCRYSYLRMIRQSVTDMSARAGLTEFQTAQLEMAVDEACANIIEHSYGGERGASAPDHPGLRINLMQCRDRVVVEIFDRGAGFDVERQRPIAPDEYMESERERGLGLFIIQKFVDDLQYERGGNAGNCLRLTKMI